MHFLAGIWIVSPQWLADSVTAGEILLEDSYEVPGYQKAGKELAPKRARLAVHAVRTRKSLTVHGTSENIIKTSELSSNHEKYPNVSCERFHSTEKCLFENTVFLLYGSFPNSGPPRSEIADLLKTGKACVVTSIKDLCVELKARDPRFNSTSVSKQDCYKGMGMGVQYQSTEGSKVHTYSYHSTVFILCNKKYVKSYNILILLLFYTHTYLFFSLIRFIQSILIPTPPAFST